MKERRFGRGDYDRVQRFYSLQWEQHEGVLIPNEKSKSAIWDAPKTLFQGVSYAQAQKYVSRVPLFMVSHKFFEIIRR
jgi:hypothetical protein